MFIVSHYIPVCNCFLRFVCAPHPHRRKQKGGGCLLFLKQQHKWTVGYFDFYQVIIGLVYPFDMLFADFIYVAVCQIHKLRDVSHIYGVH